MTFNSQLTVIKYLVILSLWAIIGHFIEGIMPRPRKYTDAELRAKINEYFKAHEDGEPITLTGLCLALRVDRRRLYEWMERKDISAQIVREAHDKIQNYWESLLSSSKTARGAEFWLKCAGWLDGQKKLEAQATDKHGNVLKVTFKTIGAEGSSNIDV